jgi:hypothetical protein
MKVNFNQPKTTLTSYLSKLTKNLIMLFESGEKREFQRLKEFISS